MSELRDMAEAINANILADLIMVEADGSVSLDMSAVHSAVALGKARVIRIGDRIKVVWLKP